MQLHIMCMLEKGRVISVHLNLTQKVLCRDRLSLSTIIHATVLLLSFNLLHGNVLTRNLFIFRSIDTIGHDHKARDA